MASTFNMLAGAVPAPQPEDGDEDTEPMVLTAVTPRGAAAPGGGAAVAGPVGLLDVRLSQAHERDARGSESWVADLLRRRAQAHRPSAAPSDPDIAVAFARTSDATQEVRTLGCDTIAVVGVATGSRRSGRGGATETGPSKLSVAISGKLCTVELQPRQTPLESALALKASLERFFEVTLDARRPERPRLRILSALVS